MYTAIKEAGKRAITQDQWTTKNTANGYQGNDTRSQGRAPKILFNSKNAIGFTKKN